MSEMTQQKQVTALLVVVAALLAGIIGLLVWQSNTVPAPSVSGTTAQDTVTDSAMPGTGIPAAAPAFDQATAPKVPADQTPEQYVNAYYELCQADDYDSAFVMLPTYTQANSYGDSAAFAAQVSGYGITSYSVAEQIERDGNIYVVGTQVTPEMPVSYTWTFVQGDDGTWLCASRDMGGMQ